MIINCLEEIFSQFGFPSVLLSDNVLKFVSAALHQFSSIHSINKIAVLPYAPFSNGLIEKQNQRILQLLKLYTYSVQEGEWDEYLLTAQNIINKTLNVSLGDTPSFICLGRDTCLGRI